VANLPTLRYGWKEGQAYEYSVSMDLDDEQGTHQLRGTLTYSISSPTGQDKRPGDEPEKGSGSGFVVDPNGHLLTCAHVVEDATSIEVTLSEKTYPARVVAVDGAHDLAILKVEAGQLPAIPLGNSDGVQLAQEVRAFGFPLSDILGNSLKVTRGTVAGFVDRDGMKMFQLDASINPGNSGGALVNEQGQLVGVTSAKLIGIDVSNVGFAVPSNYARQFLEAHRIPFQTSSEQAKLEGTELASRMKPAVGFIAVTVGHTGPLRTVSYSTHLTSRDRAKGAGPESFTEGSSRTDRGRLVLDECGKVASTGDEPSSAVYGMIAESLLIRLPAVPSKDWSTEQTVTITQVTGGSSAALEMMPFARPGFAPRPHGRPFPRGGIRPPIPRFPGAPRFPEAEPEPTAVAVLLALEKTSFQLTEVSEEAATIKRHYELKPARREETGPRLEVLGDGIVAFDRKAGVPRRAEFTAKITRVRAEGKAELPLKIVVERQGSLPAANGIGTAGSAPDWFKPADDPAAAAAAAAAKAGGK
jgi:S1-C subfamily serine protease